MMIIVAHRVALIVIIISREDASTMTSMKRVKFISTIKAVLAIVSLEKIPVNSTLKPINTAAFIDAVITTCPLPLLSIRKGAPSSS